MGLIGNESWQLTSDGNGCRQRFPRLARTSRIYVVRTTSITGFPNPPTTFFIFRKERETLVNTREVNRSEKKNKFLSSCASCCAAAVHPDFLVFARKQRTEA